MPSGPIPFTLVTGSFTPPRVYDKCEILPNEKGYETSLITLPSVNDGSRSPPATTNDDSNCIHSTLLSILDGPSLSNVILAVHSYAGLQGTSAVQGLNKASRAEAGKTTAVPASCTLWRMSPKSANPSVAS
ncbi:hypothetical protein DPSP01_009712 [Paraphaeosphaeria sporulosa]|uniref:AB hydrolase-1 domain-containing protein n=1 Tax=Paraphaeosphaeria sporulosa TaxID=1460663 RepID=A0A177CDV9_9PLEO|nr:uncharacterized protein CC84DRAFT_1165302 [Paraphaeosphaeria sporulosa]OAG04947.1 hypothetical protein CC84DRAFT_1165302 [Paraphaeosphaeria sporulosa]